MLRKLYIEPTTKCNLNCKMCFRHTWFDEPMCDLSLDDFRHVLATMPKTVQTVFFGSIQERPLAEIWSSKEYKTFRRKFDDFEFASCIYCGHCELFAENQEDCIGNSHPACGGCLWAEGVLSCP